MGPVEIRRASVGMTEVLATRFACLMWASAIPTQGQKRHSKDKGRDEHALLEG